MPSKWIIGPTNTGNGDAFRGYSIGEGDLAGAFVTVIKWNCSAGAKTIKEFGLRSAFMTNVSAAYVVVYSKSGSTMTLVASVAIAGWAVSDSAQSWEDTSIDLSVTLEEGKEYYWGFWMNRPDSNGSGRPGWRGFDSLTDSNDVYRMSLVGATTPATFDTSDGSSPTNNDEVPSMHMVYESESGVEYDSSTEFSGDTIVVPVPYETNGYVILNDWQIPNNSSGVINYQISSSDPLTNVVSANIDFGTVDQSTFAGDSLLLGVQSNDVFDAALKFGSDNSTFDFFLLNKSQGQGPQSNVDSFNREIVPTTGYVAVSGIRTNADVENLDWNII